jgi:hypothetical protein
MCTSFCAPFFDFPGNGIAHLSSAASKSGGNVSGSARLLIFSGEPLQKTVKWDSPTPLKNYIFNFETVK